MNTIFNINYISQTLPDVINNHKKKSITIGKEDNQKVEEN
jgi:hypothetical protein